MVKRKQDTKREESRKEDEISLKTRVGCRQSAKKRKARQQMLSKLGVIEDIDHKAK